MATPKHRPSRYWDFRAFFYAHYYKLTFISRLSQKEHLSLKQMWDDLPVKPSGFHLDLACGARPLKLSDTHLCLLASDSSHRMLQYAKNSYPHLNYFAADALQLPLKNQSLALITTAGLTEYLPDPDILLQEITRSLVPGGIFLFTFSHPNPANNFRRIYNPKIYFRSPEYWRKLCHNIGWEILKEKKLILQTQFLCRKNYAAS